MNDINVGSTENLVKGYAPINLDECIGTSTSGIHPEKAQRVLGDILLCEALDENEHGEVLRNGIYITQDAGTKTWRRAKVLRRGSQCRDVEVGDVVIYPSDRGIQIISANKKKYIFLNESRIFYVEEPNEDTPA